MDSFALQRLAPPAVTTLISFLSYTSQWLFYNIEPGPLRKGDAYIFNALVACILICYWRACSTDPGIIPKGWHERLNAESNDVQSSQRQRWCRKCDAFKPPRAHHCKTCKRYVYLTGSISLGLSWCWTSVLKASSCVVKMDHHCVWTANCVSHITYPHFIRFIVYAVAAMAYLECFLYERCAVLWQKRHLPSYLGPGVFQLVHLFILVVTNSLVLFMLVLLLGRTLWSLALNTTTIEGWEIERHETLLRRARTLGGYLVGPDGNKIRIERQEFPWDIGIWTNICQSMGSRNPLVWLWPFAQSPSVESGLSFEHNGIEDPSKPWPPPDPDRMFRAPRISVAENGLTQSINVDDFRKRQQADLTRYADMDGEYVVRRRPFHERLEEMQNASIDDHYYGKGDVAVESDDDHSGSDEDKADKATNAKEGKGEEMWRNREGERLADFGVDEVTDFYDEDDLPLAELIRRRKADI